MTVDTNWYVLTGPPCSGKTTTITELAKLHYNTSSEIARSYLSRLQKLPINEDISDNSYNLQEEILKLEMQREKKLDKHQLIFFDRALPDSVAYYKNIGILPKHVIDAAKMNHYKGIFFLEALPLVSDNIRKEDQDTANRIGFLIREAYQQLGYTLVDIPATNVQERIKLILQQVANQSISEK